MGKKGKSSARVSVPKNSDDSVRVPLQAILMADSFTKNFIPISLDRPEVLFPLVNVPMIHYTLTWLESTSVEEVFVFCRAHAKKVIKYLEESEWFSQPNFTVTIIESQKAAESVGDALREIFERNVIQGDFVLIGGDTVSNMSLTQALEEHKERREKDSKAVMTMVIKRSKPISATNQSRFGTHETFMAIDPNTKQLLYYEDKTDNSKGILHLDKHWPSLSLHHDKLDCYIDICSPEVLSLFTENFDYEHLRHHFVKGLVGDDIIGYKIFVHEIYSDYAGRIDNFRSYDTVSKDIIQIWTYPLVPDIMNAGTQRDRQGIYRASEISQSRSAVIGPCTVLGRGTKIGNDTKVSNSVIGEGCTIGSNVSIEGCYIWDNVTIEDGCTLRHAIVCDGVTMKSGAVEEPGVVLSFRVVVGQNFIVPRYSKASMLRIAVMSSSNMFPAITGTVDKSQVGNASPVSQTHFSPAPQLGKGGAGYVWSKCEGGLEDEWRNSVAPISADKFLDAMRAMEDDLELLSFNDSRDDSYSFERKTSSLQFVK